MCLYLEWVILVLLVVFSPWDSWISSEIKIDKKWQIALRTRKSHAISHHNHIYEIKEHHVRHTPSNLANQPRKYIKDMQWDRQESWKKERKMSKYYWCTQAYKFSLMSSSSQSIIAPILRKGPKTKITDQEILLHWLHSLQEKTKITLLVTRPRIITHANHKPTDCYKESEERYVYIE